MNRRDLVIDALGLGPQWLPRPGCFADHPAMDSPCPDERDGVGQALDESLPKEQAPGREIPVAAPSSPEPADIPVFPDWQTLQHEVATCRACRLCETRTQTVFGRGNPDSRILIVGEAPGEHEDRQGEPFVGRAGLLLDTMLATIGLDRDKDIYVANVIKCRPPGNRNPSADEIAACEPFLTAQIHHLKPALILALGRFAAHTLLQTDASIQSLRGKVHDYRGTPLIVSYHPAYLLRNLPDKARAWSDLVLVRKELGRR
ncbi:uracil-DNA glycosylase [Paludibacterium paludis]|uniref:Type-4 uracil-DNA glycosylase n=1 Tax=Paludibacterium paludis TaxID=1225769 RepID=A0A918UB23_9NEIS|nr:uracil-DNA glycosylase [Paludibacterium paludis]GGY21956.1 hypothetical protein GCM10011289_27150 [Paludibacterium paludis]